MGALLVDPGMPQAYRPQLEGAAELFPVKEVAHGQERPECNVRDFEMIQRVTRCWLCSPGATRVSRTPHLLLPPLLPQGIVFVQSDTRELVLDFKEIDFRNVRTTPALFPRCWLHEQGDIFSGIDEGFAGPLLPHAFEPPPRRHPNPAASSHLICLGRAAERPLRPPSPTRLNSLRRGTCRGMSARLRP